MKTLVIHPSDRTTDFLSAIYKDLDCTIIRRSSAGKGFIRKSIKEHNRIICLGHGTEKGLIGGDKLIINSDHVQMLREKKNGVFIWCNANVFIEKYEILNSFYSGMIVSEMQEAVDWSLIFSSVKQIDDSNDKFAKIVSTCLKGNSDPLLIKNKFLKLFKPENSIEEFNRNNIFSN